MKDAVDLEQDRLDDVVADELEAGMALEMLDVGALAAEEVVQADDVVPVAQQPLAQMRSEKSRAARHQYSHVSPSVAQLLRRILKDSRGLRSARKLARGARARRQRRFSRASASTLSIT